LEQWGNKKLLEGQKSAGGKQVVLDDKWQIFSSKKPYD
jgi:hypothetical protein